MNQTLKQIENQIKLHEIDSVNYNRIHIKNALNSQIYAEHAHKEHQKR